MKKEDLTKFTTIMAGLAEEFDGKLSKNNLKLKFKALAEYEIEEISKAASCIVKNRVEKWPAIPTTKEIIDAIERLRSPSLSNQSMAEIQACIVIDKLHSKGANAAIDFIDPVTFWLMTRVWPYNSWACEVLEKDIKWWKKEFISAYEAFGEAKKAFKIESPKELKKLYQIRDIKCLPNKKPLK